jgi:molybdate transport system ATP-binding protein
LLNKRKRTARIDNRQALIALDHCSVVLDSKAVLDDVSFVLHAGDRWALVGPNGSGKTIFLKLLRGDIWPTPDVDKWGRGRREYCFDGEISDQPYGAKERIAYVGPERQDRYVRYGWNHSAAQIVATGLFDEDIPRTQPSARQRQRVARMLRHFRLWSLRSRGFLTLSYGQRRRVLVARAFVAKPRVLLLDEVFNGLDAVSAGILRDALARRSVGSTWIVTTHRARDVPKSATRTARMEQGRLVVVASASLLNRISTQRAERKLPLLSKIPTLRRRHRNKTPLVQLRNVDLYRDYRPVLRDVNWTIARAEHWAILGHNGSGKSSLLNVVYGDLHPRLGGTVDRDRVPFGTPIAEWKRRVGFLSPELQADYFLARDLEEVVMSGRYSSVGLNHASTRGDRRAARRWLTFFGLDEVEHRGPRAVSYGQMRRALLARAMINDPELLLLDEPCTGLDPASRAVVLSLLERLARRGVQLVMAVHERSDLPGCINHCLRIRRDRTVQVVKAKTKE